MAKATSERDRQLQTDMLIDNLIERLRNAHSMGQMIVLTSLEQEALLEWRQAECEQAIGREHERYLRDTIASFREVLEAISQAKNGRNVRQAIAQMRASALGVLAAYPELEDPDLPHSWFVVEQDDEAEALVPHRLGEKEEG